MYDSTHGEMPAARTHNHTHTCTHRMGERNLIMNKEQGNYGNGQRRDDDIL